MKLKLVCVTWVDARADAGWFDHHDGDLVENEPVKTYGLLVEHREDYIILASTFDPETGRWSDRNCIPAGMVKSVKTIKTVEA